MEQWRDVLGFKGLYIVSNYGRVHSLPHTTLNILGYYQSFPGKMMTPVLKDDGKHLLVMLTKSGKHYKKFIHVLVATAFIGPCPPGMECCHNDGDGFNNWAGNLRWDTRSNNNYDRGRHGTDWARNKIECPRNHLLQLPNLVRSTWEKHRRRDCLACARARGNKQTAQRSGMSFDFRTVANIHYNKIIAVRLENIGA
jgi:hypothetical protein